MGFKNQGQLERGFNAGLVKREIDILGGGRIQVRMGIVSNDLGLGAAQCGRNTPAWVAGQESRTAPLLPSCMICGRSLTLFESHFFCVN